MKKKQSVCLQSIPRGLRNDAGHKDMTEKSWSLTVLALESTCLSETVIVHSCAVRINAAMPSAILELYLTLASDIGETHISFLGPQVGTSLDFKGSL